MSYYNSYKIDLPATADYFQWDPQFTPHYFGPQSRHVTGFDAYLTSRDWCIVGDTVTDDYILLGAVTVFRSFTYFTLVKEQGRFREVIITQPETTEHDKPEEVIILRGNDWRDLLQQYAASVAKRMSACVPDTTQNSVGYCSWYYNYDSVTEDQFLQNMEAIRLNGDVFSAKYMQIDDGYKACHGDWLIAHPNWPTSLKETVKKINDAGFEAGIWTMPLIAATSSKLYSDHPDWFVKDDENKALVIEGWSPAPDNVWACLDTSIPAVEDHLIHIYQTFYTYGFRYFKLDGIGFSAPRGRRHDPQATGVSAFRHGLEIIREAVGDSIILGCGAIMPCIGLVDHCRISTDTAIRWQCWGLPTEEVTADTAEPANPCLPGLENALKVSLSHWWTYDSYFRADPDVVIARQENAFITEGEARMSALVAAMTGVAFTSDRLDFVDDYRKSLLKFAAENRIRNSRPLDWKKKAWPHVYEGTFNDKRAIAIFNFSESVRKWKLSDLGLSNAVEMLHPLGNVSGIIEIGPHDGVLLVHSCGV